MFKNTKAVSALVATVLLILITVAAVGIIWGAILPLITSSLDLSRACFEAQLRINTDQGFTCYNTTSREVQAMVSRGSQSFTLAGVQLIVSGGGKTSAFTINRTDIITGSNKVRDYGSNYTIPNTMSFPNSNEDRTYVLNTNLSTTNVSRPDTLKIAPIVQIGGSQKICEATSSVSIIPCA